MFEARLIRYFLSQIIKTEPELENKNREINAEVN